MHMYKIQRTYLHQNYVNVSKDLALKLSVDGLDYITLRYGLKSTKVSLNISSDTNETFVTISADVFDDLGIQSNLKYELLMKDNEVIIGPLIGILVAKTEKGLESEKAALDRYVHFYEKIGGSIIAFSLAGINKDSSTITGYLYDPISKAWISGKFPFPQAIFNRIILSEDWRTYLNSMVGKKYFNSFYFNKWEMYELLSPSPNIRKHLPNTVLYRSFSDIYHLLNQHSKVFIKPIVGSLGKGIYELSITKEGYLLRTRINKKNITKSFQSKKRVNEYLLKKLSNKRYVIQEALDLSFNGKNVNDFRMSIVKDQNGEWKDLGFLGRQGPKNSVVSNRSNGGKMEVGEDTLKRIFNMTDEEAEAFRKKMAHKAILAAENLDSKFHYGNFGVDLAVDKNKHIWILEFNNRDPHHFNAINAGRQDIVDNVCLSNILYAKHLAGFTTKGG